MPGDAQIFNYHAVNAFPDLRLLYPVSLAFAPGDDSRVFVVEKLGRIRWFPNENTASELRVFLDLTDIVYSKREAGFLSLAFHPQFEDNGSFFVYYTLEDSTSQGTGLHDRLSRFSISSTDKNAADPDSEIVLINQFDEHPDHNGGGLDFGPDGYLYLSLGDEGMFYDRLENGQRIDKDFFSAILRIDVDRRQGNRLPNPHPASSHYYSIPRDNPFVNSQSFGGQPVEPSQVRTEFYAVGFRNPWRFSFDWKTGNLYGNDTGGHTREEINRIVKGGNYGWPKREGSMPGPPRLADYSEDHPFLNPVAEYGRYSGDDIAAGLVYRGDKYPSLDGAYLFSDFWNGYIGAFPIDDAPSSRIQWIFWNHGVSHLRTNPKTGDVLMVNLARHRIQKLVIGPDPGRQPLPGKLSETGAFNDVKDLEPAEFLTPYDINAPFWSDNAIKTRWIALPDDASKIGIENDLYFRFPTGTTFIKHFELEMEKGNPDSKRRVETRFLTIADSGTVSGVTYRWNEAQDEAFLAPAQGLEQTYSIWDGGAFREQIWRFPSRRECVSCHNGNANNYRHVLGFNIPQLNRPQPGASKPPNQLRALEEAGYFKEALGDRIHVLPKLASMDDESYSVEFRVKSYLHANCVGCHDPIIGKSRMPFDFRFTTSLANADIINGSAYNSFGNPTALVVKPGHPEDSVLFRRISRNDIGRMPPLASRLIDAEAASLIERWIKEDLTARSDWTSWVQERFGTNPSEMYEKDPDGDGGNNWMEYLGGTDPLEPDSRYGFDVRREANATILELPQPANVNVQVQWTLDPFDSSSWRALEVPDNTPFYPSSFKRKTVRDPNGTHQEKYYRYEIQTP